MRIKDLPIYVVFSDCFTKLDMQDWKKLMRKSYKRYTKMGLQEADILTRIDLQYTKILLHLAAKHPEAFKNQEKLEKIQQWMHSPESILKVEETKEEHND